MARPLAQRSAAAYRRLLTRAFGEPEPTTFDSFAPEVDNWTKGTCTILKAAIKHRCSTLGRHTEPTCQTCSPARVAVPNRWAARRKVAVPGEADARAYEGAAASLPGGRRALALIPLALGLRAEELCSISRENVKRAIRSGELIVLRKGGTERVIPVSGVTELLAELLETPAAPGRRYRPVSAPSAKHAWSHVGEILSPGKYITQYHLLRNLIRRTGAKAELDGMRPHLLRHVFATRMNRDGAPTATIQAALGHAQITTTQRYVHPDSADVAKHQRNFNSQPAPVR